MEASLFILIVSLTAVRSAIRDRGGPKNALMKVDDHVVLTCNTTGTGCDHVDWQKVEGPQSPKPIYQYGRGLLNPVNFDPQRYNISELNGCNLNITGLKMDDSGRFICMHKPSNEAETTKSAVLVVVDVTSSCVSNVTNKELAEGDGYSFVCAISIPLKSLEPSDVTLSWYDKAVKMDSSLETTTPVAVRSTFSSTATRHTVTEYSCKATLHALQQAGFDDTNRELNICSTEKLTVHFPVGDIAVSPSPHRQGATVYCTASGYPIPKFTWKHSEGNITDGSLLVIAGKAGEMYECTATNTVKGKVHTQTIAIEVSGEGSGCGSGCVAAIVITILVIIGIIVTLFSCWKFKECLLHEKLHSLSGNKSKASMKPDAEDPLTGSHGNSNELPPKKPPRISDPVPYRPHSDVLYAELRPEDKPCQLQSNPVNNSPVVYASVVAA